MLLIVRDIAKKTIITEIEILLPLSIKEKKARSGLTFGFKVTATKPEKPTANTIIVTNTSEVSVTYTLSDTLSNEASQIILTPQLVWSSTSTNVAVLPPYNYIRKSSNFSVISSNSGASNNLESNYWHWDGSRRSNNLNYY